MYEDRTLLQQHANAIGAWWQKYQRDFAWQIYESATEIGNCSRVLSPVTVLVSTSFIPSHPSTQIIDETIESIRKYLPNCEIIIMFDGVRSEDEYKQDRYFEYTRRVLDACAYKWHNVLPIISDKWVHQAEMTRRALELVHTPYVLFVEHDTPLTGEIPVDKILEALAHPEVNSVRLYHYPSVPPEHQYMFGERKDICGIPMQKTFQWSQRPHWAKTQWYREVMQRFFAPGVQDFVEETMHPILRKEGWTTWMGMWIYAPERDMIRSIHRFGRTWDGT
jgi:hypothetical protein